MKQTAREVAFLTELPLLRIITEGRLSHIEGGNYQVPFRLFRPDNSIVYDAIQGEWYEQLVNQFARSVSCVEAKAVELQRRVDAEFINARVEFMLQ